MLNDIPRFWSSVSFSGSLYNFQSYFQWSVFVSTSKVSIFNIHSNCTRHLTGYLIYHVFWKQLKDFQNCFKNMMNWCHLFLVFLALFFRNSIRVVENNSVASYKYWNFARNTTHTSAVTPKTLNCPKNSCFLRNGTSHDHSQPPVWYMACNI